MGFQPGCLFDWIPDNRCVVSGMTVSGRKRVDAMRDRDIDLSDDPVITPEQFANAIVRKGLNPLA